MDERMRFVGRLLEGERMSDLCREYGISRKTGYKFLDRYRAGGTVRELSRRPHFNPRQTPKEIERLVVEFRKLRPTWGPKKIKAKLEQVNKGICFPSASTIGEILDKKGLVKKRRRKRFQERLFPSSTVTQTNEPNEVWCTDFKGHFSLLNKRRCHPLTISDHFSRFLVGCESLEDEKTDTAKESFEAIFDEYGVPHVILSDNGPPFGSHGLAGLSKLSVWWMSLGIEPQKIEPGHPEQNGRHERMHLTLKQETTRPPGQNHLQQQERFDLFRQEYNHYRPHEALKMKPPSFLYKNSKRSYSEASKPLEYPLHDEVRKINTVGQFRFIQGRLVTLSAAFAGHKIGIRDLGHDIFLVSFANKDIGYIDWKQKRLFPDHPREECDA